LIGERLGGRHADLEEEFEKLPSLIEKTISMASEKCQQVARFLAKKEYLYYLGFGISIGACLEGALKMKEITYIPCEGMYSSEFKHGPLAIIKKNDWVLFLSTLEDVHMTLSHINEVSCRLGKICAIAPPDDSLSLNSDELISLPSKNYFQGNRGILFSPKTGQPRNISKTLTVD